MSIKFQQCISRQDRLYYTDRQAGRQEGRKGERKAGTHSYIHTCMCFTNAANNDQIKIMNDQDAQ